MDRHVRYLALALMLPACSGDQVALGFPTELLDGTFATAILLLQSGEEPNASVVAAEVLDLPPTTTWRHDLGERNRVRVLAYATRPDGFDFASGPLPQASTGEGLALPAPDRAFASTALTAGAPSWMLTTDVDTRQIPWRVPDETSNDSCPDAPSETWRLDGLANTRPRALISRGIDHLIIVGQTNEPDGITPQASLFVSIRNIDASPTIESVAPPLQGQSYQDVLWVSDDVVLASSKHGWLTRVDLQSNDVLSVPALRSNGRWTLHRGDDGAILAFDARVELEGDVRGDARWIDPTTLSTSAFQAPEPIVQAAVMNRDLVITAGERNLYRYQAGEWTMELSTSAPVTAFVRGSSRLVAVIGGTQVLERSQTGTWTDLSLDDPLLNMQVGTFIDDARLVLGGGHGVMMLHREGKWCRLPPGVSREIYALTTVDATSAIATYYSETNSEPLSFTRVLVQPGP